MKSGWMSRKQKPSKMAEGKIDRFIKKCVPRKIGDAIRQRIQLRMQSYSHQEQKHNAQQNKIIIIKLPYSI